MSLMARFLYGGVRLYQRASWGRPSPCRFVPTCSNYALDAFEHHGAVRGSALTMRRLSRCHPWGGHGWDPVPEGKHH
jgi:putative membrane protein insertion efficiency factor